MPEFNPTAPMIPNAPTPQPQQDTPAPPATPIGDAQDAPPIAQVADKTNPPLPANSQVNHDPNAIPGSVEPRHNFLGDALQLIAGGKKISYQQTDNGPVPVTENLKSGELASHILAAALTGLAGGFGPEGRGKGAGGALAAGFNAEQKRTDQVADENKKQAQQQFQNQQETNELVLRKNQYALAMHDDIRKAQELVLFSRNADQQYERGNLEMSNLLLDNRKKQAQEINDLNDAKYKTLDDPEHPGQLMEVKSLSELNALANRFPKQFVGEGGDALNRRLVPDPNNDGKFFVYVRAKNDKDPQPLGVKLDANGKPVLVNGHRVSNGTLSFTPAGDITMETYLKLRKDETEASKNKYDASEALARTALLRDTLKDKESLRVATAHLLASQGNPFAVNPKTHLPFMSDEDRAALINFHREKRDLAAAGVLDAQGKLKDQDPSSPGYAATLDVQRKLWDEFNDSQATYLMLTGAADGARKFGQNVRAQFTKPDGYYDEAGAQRAIDTTQGISSGFRQIARQEASGEALTAGERGALDRLIKFPKDQQAVQIQQAKVPESSKTKLYKYLGLTPPTSANPLYQVDPSKTLIRNKTTGETIEVNNSAVKPNDLSGAVANGQDWEVVGRGIRPPAQSAPDSNSVTK